jgi:hypothetical protein
LALEFSAAGISKKVVAKNLGDAVIPPATAGELMSLFSLDADSIADTVAAEVKKPVFMMGS